MGRAFQQILNITLVACLLLSCNKDKQAAQPTSPGQAPPSAGSDKRYVYVACEGSYTNGNASLSMQELTTLTQYDNVYLNTNGEMLGDVFQSIEKIDDQLFLCINNSDKVLVIDAKTRKNKGTISIPKPRYILPIHSEKAYVSTEYSNKVYVINPKTRTIEKTIEMPAQNPEGMALLGSRAYITTWDKHCNKVYIVSIVNDEVTDSFTLAGYAPHDVLVDGNGFVWVLSGNVPEKVKATLTKLAPGTADIVSSYTYGEQQDPIKLRMNKAGDELYFIGVDYNGASSYNGIYRMNVQDATLPASPLIAAQKLEYFWGLGIDPVTDDIYVGNPKGFIQKGTVNVYDNSGLQKRSFEVGVGPGYFYFDE